MKALEHSLALFFRNAHAGVAYSQLNRAVHPLQRQRHLAFEGELECVRQQVEDDLLPHVAVDINRLTQRLAVHRESQARFFHRRAEDAGDLRGKAGEIGRLIDCLHAPSFDAGEIQQRVDQLQQAQGIAAGGNELLVTFRAETLARFRQNLFQRTQHQRQRSAKLVADVAEELRLGAIEFGQLLGSIAFGLIGGSVGDGSRDLVGEQREKSFELVAQRAMRI